MLRFGQAAREEKKVGTTACLRDTYFMDEKQTPQLEIQTVVRVNFPRG